MSFDKRKEIWNQQQIPFTHLEESLRAERFSIDLRKGKRKKQLEISRCKPLLPTLQSHFQSHLSEYADLEKSEILNGVISNSTEETSKRIVNWVLDQIKSEEKLAISLKLLCEIIAGTSKLFLLGTTENLYEILLPLTYDIDLRVGLNSLICLSNMTHCEDYLEYYLKSTDHTLAFNTFASVPIENIVQILPIFYKFLEVDLDLSVEQIKSISGYFCYYISDMHLADIDYSNKLIFESFKYSFIGIQLALAKLKNIEILESDLAHFEVKKHCLSVLKKANNKELVLCTLSLLLDLMKMGNEGFFDEGFVEEFFELLVKFWNGTEERIRRLALRGISLLEFVNLRLFERFIKVFFEIVENEKTLDLDFLLEFAYLIENVTSHLDFYPSTSEAIMHYPVSSENSLINLLIRLINTKSPPNVIISLRSLEKLLQNPSYFSIFLNLSGKESLEPLFYHHNDGLIRIVQDFSSKVLNDSTQITHLSLLSSVPNKSIFF